MFTAELTDVTNDHDTLSVYEDGTVIEQVNLAPTGRAVDYEKALLDAGYKPVSFEGSHWNLEKV